VKWSEYFSICKLIVCHYSYVINTTRKTPHDPLMVQKRASKNRVSRKNVEAKQLITVLKKFWKVRNKLKQEKQLK
jgi:hypothetical protein